MGILKKHSMSLALVMALSANSVNAGISDFIQKSLNAKTTETSAGYYKSQVSGLATLGGARVRWGGVDNIRPFNVQTPHINVGCSGIDMVFGGFSYLNFEYLIEKLKKISTAAPAFAFKMALSTLCKDCDTIITALEDISNEINKLNFDSCQALSNWSNRLGEKLSGVGLTGVEGGQVASWLQGMNDGLSKWVEKSNNFINGIDNNNPDSKNTTIIYDQGSLLQQGLKNLKSVFKQLMGEKEYEKILRAVFGDVIGHKLENKEDVIPKYTHLPPSINTEEFVKTLGGDKNNPEQSIFTITNYEIAEIGDSGMYRIKNLGTEEIRVESYYGILKKQIQAIIDKGITDQPLEQADISLISSLDLPTWHLINIAIANSMNADAYIEIISTNAFKGLINKFANNVYSQIATIIGQMSANGRYDTPEAKEALSAFQKDIREISSAIINTMDKQLEHNEKTLNANTHLQKLYQEYLIRSKGAK
ncbi:hypothetical protein LS72_010210 [Helicobacter apodemus]|uniref:Conjugal transfer protein TraG n=1 Tax=Helicobacter apodemus TaxID=135569 RepID=A0A4U8UBR5_9HELI|nr:conjugal transfer protein TraH [Helicobacter apodemus]TLE13123.1 hypothetical protein LS72_010210 [Helicobacter apodemus]